MGTEHKAGLYLHPHGAHLGRDLHWVPIPMHIPMHIPMPTHTHGFWVGMGTILLFMGGHGWAWVGIGFTHPCIQFQVGVKLLKYMEYVNQEALRAKAIDSERLFICRI
jgi:hypothetical protein